jgi:hypothetical protein
MKNKIEINEDDWMQQKTVNIKKKRTKYCWLTM